ncbi:hypothetical protein CPB85DRAFT_1459903 [Mucidula mucida]|nr:hypothetical protein CPB85DRAFT_1459903 [Mucidula mucida]
MSQPLPTLRMEFRPATLLQAQQPQITNFARAVRENNRSELGSSTTAIVYSYGPSRTNYYVFVDLYCFRHNSQWWHTTTNDPRRHVTVRYDRRVPATRRVHIYEDGSANLFPHQGTTAVAESVPLNEEGSDGSVEFSDEEGQEFPEPATK